MLKIFLLILIYFNSVNNQLHDLEVKAQASLTAAEEVRGPQSIAECVMRCQRKTKEGFFTDDGKCFCHMGFAENIGNANGILSKECKMKTPENGE